MAERDFLDLLGEGVDSAFNQSRQTQAQEVDLLQTIQRMNAEQKQRELVNRFRDREAAFGRKHTLNREIRDIQQDKRTARRDRLSSDLAIRKEDRAVAKAAQDVKVSDASIVASNARVRASDALANQRFIKTDGSVDWKGLRGWVIKGMFNRVDDIGVPIANPTMKEVREVESLFTQMQREERSRRKGEKNRQFVEDALAGGAKIAKESQDESMEAEIARLKKKLGKD